MAERKKRAPSRQKLANDARFEPHREQAAQALREFDLSPPEIAVKYKATYRHIGELAEELGIDLKERGFECARRKRKAQRPHIDVDMDALRRHLNDPSLSLATLMKIHGVDKPSMQALAKSMGFDWRERTQQYLKYRKHGKRNHGREMELIGFYEQRRESMSGNGKSLKLLGQPWL